MSARPRVAGELVRSLERSGFVVDGVLALAAVVPRDLRASVPRGSARVEFHLPSREGPEGPGPSADVAGVRLVARLGHGLVTHPWAGPAGRHLLPSDAGWVANRALRAREVARPRPGLHVSNERFAEALRVVLAGPFADAVGVPRLAEERAVRLGLHPHPVPLPGVLFATRVAALDELTEERLALALAVLTDLADGVPTEWVLRRAAVAATG